MGDIMSDKWKTTGVEDYESGEIKVSYSITNRTSLIPSYVKSPITELKLTVKLAGSPSMNVQALIPTSPECYETIEERVIAETERMCHSIAKFIHEDMGIANIYLKHLKGIEAMMESKDE